MEILTLGEPLLEFNEIVDSKGERIYLPGFGGDTSNFAIASARQGAKVGYQTKVGNDAFGRKFIDLWKREGVDISLVQTKEEAHTGLYFITHSDEGHDFVYHRQGSAASTVSPNDINESAFKGLKFLHVSGITQAISNTSLDAVFQAIEYAKRNEVMVSYDPNLRLKLWPLPRARVIIESTMLLCDYFMPSLEEAQLISGKKYPEEIIDYFLNKGVKFIVLKVGKEGVYLANHQQLEKINAFSVDAVDATGAGDTFDGAFISKLIGGSTEKEAALYANAAASISTTGYGAVNPIPTQAQVEAFLREQI